MCHSTQAMERHRLMLAMNRWVRKALPTGNSEVVSGQRYQHPAAQRALQYPAYVMRRVRVSQQRTRLIRLKRLPSHLEPPSTHPVRQTEIVLRNVSPRALTPAALIEALEHLRHDLINLQNPSPPSCPPEGSDGHTECRKR